jgi:hypothetical protein
MNLNNFTELYHTWATDQLLDIIDNPSYYQPMAVDAARLELESRHLSAAQLEAAKKKQADRQKIKADKLQRTKAFGDKIKSVGSTFTDTYNPTQHEPLTTDTYIKLISLFLGGLSVYQVFKELDMLGFMLTDPSASWDLSMVLYFLPLLLAPAAGLLFWFRKRAGWILSTLFFTNMAAGALLLFLSAMNRQPSGNAALDTLFPSVSPAAYIGSLLISGGAIWVMAKEPVRAVYSIHRQTMFTTIALGAVATILMTIMLLYNGLRYYGFV